MFPAALGLLVVGAHLAIRIEDSRDVTDKDQKGPEVATRDKERAKEKEKAASSSGDAVKASAGGTKASSGEGNNARTAGDGSGGVIKGPDGRDLISVPVDRPSTVRPGKSKLVP